ncbi:MAG: hypothetical protein NTW85_12205 [Methylococcales bacterium]|nr:hypothetical protein [Methylococcales bacterium]
MIYFIPHQDFFYTRMMLFSWMCDSAPTILSQSNGEHFVEHLKKDGLSTTKLIVINCNDINDIDDHFIDPIKEYLLSTKKDIIFFSTDEKSIVVKHFVEHLDKNQHKNIHSFCDGDTESYCFINKSFCSSTVKNTISNALELEKQWLIKEVKETYKEFDNKTRLSSTPLIASGEFNAFMLISNPLKFRWVAILLAEIINRVVQEERPDSYTIVAVSLRGAAIAGAVWEILHYLSGPKIHIVDHIGPRHDILEAPNRDQNLGLGYCVYIGDFLIAGTEAKIASAYCNFLGGRVRHAFVIGKYTKQESLGSDMRLHSLVSLRDCCIDNLSYSLD